MRFLSGIEPTWKEQLPTLWLPWPVNQVSVISDKLHGALPQDPYQQIYPQS